MPHRKPESNFLEEFEKFINTIFECFFPKIPKNNHKLNNEGDDFFSSFSNCFFPNYSYKKIEKKPNNYLGDDQNSEIKEDLCKCINELCDHDESKLEKDTKYIHLRPYLLKIITEEKYDDNFIEYEDVQSGIEDFIESHICRFFLEMKKKINKSEHSIELRHDKDQYLTFLDKIISSIYENQNTSPQTRILIKNYQKLQGEALTK